MKKASITATRTNFIRQTDDRLDDEMVFDGRKVALALTFHLTEENPSMRVPASAIESLALRLVQAKVHLHVSRKLWAALTNPERLKILAEATGGHASTWI